MSSRGRVLYVDAYDSFSNNVVGLLQQHLGVEVKIVHIDDEAGNRDLAHTLQDVDAVVIGPGPGSPAKPDDVGFINQIWALPDEHVLPVLGICLGFQSLGLHFGASVTKLPSPRHGLVTKIFHTRTGIFDGVGDLWATQYHSLRVELGDRVSPLRPLAWDMGGDANGSILMGVQHVEKPFWGLQFHPESICTCAEGPKIVRNWWSGAQDWLRWRRGDEFWLKGPSASLKVSRVSMPDGSLTSREAEAPCKNLESPKSPLAIEIQRVSGTTSPHLQWAHVSSDAFNIVDLCETMGWSQEDIVALDSQGHKSGRYSIVGVVESGATVQVTYKSWNHTLSFWSRPERKQIAVLDSIDQLWPMLQESLDLQNPQNATCYLLQSSVNGDADTPSSSGLSRDCPFWGGFMGYISYEAGLETINVDLHESCANSKVPDCNFAFMYRSVVFDHQESRVYVQSLLPRDQSWILRTCETMASINRASSQRRSPKGKPGYLADVSLEATLAHATIKRPTGTSYRAKVLDCQRYLADGDSYELCLTDQTEVKVPNTFGTGASPWAVYKKLRELNAAPFGAFVRLSEMLVASSSPERFCHWSRSTHCQFRPMKGTVKKTPDMTRERAHDILNSPKERAENLMIVDLIRHDLGGVVGASNVSVSKLMVVEEYATVFQLVSVIQGFAPPKSDSKNPAPRGLDVLAASLPPGSMTGAPKKRSCEILREIERRPRGVYSGVLGYLDVGGGGDFSVVIRTATTMDIKDTKEQKEDRIWSLGAGGAVTIQSTAEAEFQEMETKAHSALRAFQPLL